MRVESKNFRFRVIIIITSFLLSQTMISSSTKFVSSMNIVRNHCRQYSRDVSYRSKLLVLDHNGKRQKSWNSVHSSFVFRRSMTSVPNDSELQRENNTNNNPINNDDVKNQQKKYKKSKKFVVNTDVSSQVNMDKLAAAFNDLARKEGFDSSTAYYANDETFEDDFNLDADDDDDDNDIDGDDANDDDDDFIDFGNTDDNNIDMDQRIANARRDMSQGTISVPKQLDTFVSEVTTADLRRLGFKREINPYGIDETKRKEQFKLISNAMVCSACGSDFQSSNELRPGFIPLDKFDIQARLAKVEEMQKLQIKKDSDEWSTDEEIDWLIQTAGTSVAGSDGAKKALDTLDIDDYAASLGLNLEELADKKIICKRCHNLQNSGKVEDILRPGWTKEPLLSQEMFQKLLVPLSQQPAVIIALVDLFDFSGSVLTELDKIAGNNPVILAANKADLLPSQMGPARIERWVRRELDYLGIRSLEDNAPTGTTGGLVRLISCKTGMGVESMLEKARRMADEMDCNIYIVGAANSGKSTLMNRLLTDHRSQQIAKKLNTNDDNSKNKKLRAGNMNKIKDAVTVSPLPGTTLKFISTDIGNGRKLYDTPGLLVPGTLTQLLTPEELKMVVPKSQVEPITFRVPSGKCVLVGGLAKVELIGDCKPFLFTFFVGNAIKLHPTDSLRADEYIKNHVGIELVPPLAPGPERLLEIGEFDEHIITVDGMGWKEAGADITLTGLGWVAVTGAGVATVKVTVPKGVCVELRPPLMPFDVWEVTAKYTGARAVRKTTKKSSGKRNSGVGRN